MLPYVANATDRDHRDETDQPTDRPLAPEKCDETRDAHTRASRVRTDDEVLPRPVPRLEGLATDLVDGIPQAPQPGDTRRAHHGQVRGVVGGIVQPVPTDRRRPIVPRSSSTRSSSRMHANSHDPRSSPAYVGPAVRAGDRGRRRDGRDRRLVQHAARSAATHGRDDDGRSRARDDDHDRSGSAQPRRRPPQATGPIDERHEQQPFGTASMPPTRERAGRDPQPRVAARAACNASSIVPSASGTKSRLGHQRTVRRDQDRADCGERGRAQSDPRPAIRRPTSPVSATVARRSRRPRVAQRVSSRPRTTAPGRGTPDTAAATPAVAARWVAKTAGSANACSCRMTPPSR